jgi:hypothetical protein
VTPTEGGASRASFDTAAVDCHLVDGSREDEYVDWIRRPPPRTDEERLTATVRRASLAKAVETLRLVVSLPSMMLIETTKDNCLGAFL